MSEAIVDLVKALLGAQFPTVAGFAGLLFILLGLIPGEIRWGFLVFPRRDGLGRGLAILLGTAFVSVPLLSLHLNVTLGLFNFSSEPETEDISTPSGLLIGTAYAAAPRGDVYTVPQRTVVRTTGIMNGAPTALYAGDVHIKESIVILVFRSDGPNASKVGNGRDYNEDDIKGLLSSDEIIFLKSLRQGDQQSFLYNGASYLLKVEEVIWYLIGPDVVKVSITSQ